MENSHLFNFKNTLNLPIFCSKKLKLDAKYSFVFALKDKI